MTLAAMARQVSEIFPYFLRIIPDGAHRRPERVGSAFSLRRRHRGNTAGRQLATMPDALLA